MKLANETDIKFLKILSRLFGGFWFLIGIFYLIGGYFFLALIQFVFGLFFLFLPNIIRRIRKKYD